MKCSNILQYWIISLMSLHIVSGQHSLSSYSDLPCQNILVPAYFDPSSDASDWDSMYGNPGIIIMNPDSGPGTSQETEYVNALKSAISHGNQVIGYVHTSYGKRNMTDVKSDINKYYQWYGGGNSGISGIFLDEVSWNKNELNYYSQLFYYIRSINSFNGNYNNDNNKLNTLKDNNNMVVLNPGCVPDIGYYNISDIIVAFESDINTYNDDYDPSWTLNVDSSHISHIIYNVENTNDLNDVINTSRKRNAMYLFVTQSNAYSSLPSYWDDETTIINSEC